MRESSLLSTKTLLHDVSPTLYEEQILTYEEQGIIENIGERMFKGLTRSNTVRLSSEGHGGMVQDHST